MSKSSLLFRVFHKKRIFENLDNLLDFLVILLCVVLLVQTVLLLGQLFTALGGEPDFKKVTSDGMFIVIIVELFRLLAVYLDHHHIAVGVAVEVTAVSVLREVIVEGIIHLQWPMIAAICGFLLASGALLYIESVIVPQDQTHGHNGDAEYHSHNPEYHPHESISKH